MPSQCPSCIFRTDGHQAELRPGRLDEIRAYLIAGAPHACHWPQTHGGPRRACRGGRDFQLQCWHRMGMIPEPTDAALAEAMRSYGLLPPEPETTDEPAVPS
jgi:hypothetical protein